MNQDNLEKIKKELEQEFEENEKKLEVYNERAITAENNQFNSKLELWSLFAIIAYIILSILAITTNIFPKLFIPGIILGGSLVSGLIGSAIIMKITKFKERLKSFSTAKNEREKLREEIKYAIEIEKTNNRNMAIKQTLDNLDSKQVLSSFAKNYDISYTDTENIKLNNQKLEEILIQKYQELDLLSAKEVLDRKFNKFFPVRDKIASSLVSGLIFLMAFAGPFIFVKDIINISFLIVPITYGTGFLVSLGYILKRNRDIKQIFQNIGYNIGEDILENKQLGISYDEQIKNKIKDISIISTQLQENKILLESIEDNKQKLMPTNDFVESRLLEEDKSKLNEGPSLVLKKN